MKKRLSFLFLTLLGLVLGTSASFAQDFVEVSNYKEDFSKMTASVMAEGWTKNGTIESPSTSSSARHSSTGKAWYYAGKASTYNGVITPAVKGEVKFYAKCSSSYQLGQGNASFQVYAQDGTEYIKVAESDETFSDASFTEIALNAESYTKYLIVSSYAYISDFSADYAQLPVKRVLTLVSGTTTPSSGKVYVDESNKVAVTGSVKIKNDGNVALTTADENYKVDIVDYGHNNAIVANVTLPATLAVGEEADCSFSGEIVIPENPTLNSYGEYRSRIDAKEYFGGTTKMISTAWLDIVPYISYVELRFGSSTYEDPAKTINYGTFSGSKANQFRVRNMGSKPLVITGANCGEGISTDLEFPVTLNGGEELYFNIILGSETTKAIAGTVELISNADKGITTISVAGACVAEGTYFVDFEDGQIPEGWYKGSTNWAVESLGYSYQTETNKKVLTNGTQSPLVPITTCKLHMKAGEALSFQVAKKTNYGGELVVSYATERNGEWTEALHLGYNAEHGTTILPSATNEYALYSVVVPAEGDYYFKFEAGYVYVNDVFGGEPVAVAHDVIPVSIAAAAPYIVNNAIALTAKFDNANTAAESGYKVEFIVDEEVVATLEGEDIAVGGSKSFSASYTPHAAGEHIFVAKLTSEDGTSVCTESLTINVAPESLTNDVTAGNITTSSSTSVPFYSNYRNSTSEFIYTADRLQTEAGKIVKIAYPYYNTAGDNNAMVRIWLQNTEDATADEKLTDKDQMTLVYENKNFKFPKAGSYGNFTNLEFTLDEGFDYTGGNLRVVVERYATEYKSYYFAAEALKSGEKILYKYTDTYGGKTTNEEVQQGDYLSTASLRINTTGTYYPIIILGMAAEPAKLTGTITADGNAVEGVNVTAVSGDVEYYGTTDAEGKYEIPVIQFDKEYTIVVDGVYGYNKAEVAASAEGNNIALVRHTVVLPETVNTYKYTTLFDSQFDMEIPAGAKAYIAESVENNEISYTEITDYIPANTGVLIYAPEALADLEVKALTEKPAEASTYSSIFFGYDEATTPSAESGYNYYKLQYSPDEDKVAFYLGAPDGGVFECKANRAYLKLSNEISAPKFFALPVDDATAIKNANATANSNARYSINGQKVNANYRGIVIENGKKKLVK